MLLQLLDCLEKSKEILTRRSAILKVENTNKTHLPLIKGIIKVKYKLEESVTKRNLEEAQLAKLYNEIERKITFKLVNIIAPSKWLKKGKIMPHNESVCINNQHPITASKYKEVGANQINSKNIISLILDGLTTVKEPTININKKSDLEEDNEVVKRAEKMIQK
ncbi:hypothetical protein CWI36_0168p0050 [Hamiltosporidium magnivora]|uniref:Uncharacterized protein n=1 Tax=Hamiltosporidium magnivora TaxID=148818 RepID=A0A4Q9LLG2_9MICR|nr:hypothetical protein CWI36_0168p0050 [Hamiltosporidium magnivora]